MVSSARTGFNGGMRKQTPNKATPANTGSTSTPKKKNTQLRKTWKDTYQASLVSSARTDFMWRISPAMRKHTPIGARWTTQDVT